VSWIRSFLLKNFRLKALALVTASGLWFFLAAGDRVESSFEAAVRYVNVPDNLELNPDQAAAVTVILQGLRPQLRELRNQGVWVEVNLGKVYGPGETTVNIDGQTLKLPGGVELIKAVPSQLRFSLEKRASREVEVQPVFVGAYEPGYSVASASVDPPTLVVTGPQQRVNLIDRVTTDPIDISEVIGNRSFRVTAYVPDPYLRFEGNPEVTVEVRMGRR
jgi:YbbR domain-containing protein